MQYCSKSTKGRQNVAEIINLLRSIFPNTHTYLYRNSYQRVGGREQPQEAKRPKQCGRRKQVYGTWTRSGQRPQFCPPEANEPGRW